MTDNSESELAIARAKNTKTFWDWEKLAPDCELVYGGRTFIKGHVNVLVGMTDEDRLIERINQNYASSQKQYLLKKQQLRKEKDEVIRPALSPDDTPQTAAAKSKPTYWKKWLPLKEGGKIEYNGRWFMKDKEGNGEKELLEEIFKNNEKSRASRAKSDEDKKKDSAAADLILFSLGEVSKPTVMAKLPPSARGQNRDDFDDKKNAAEEGLKADVEKNDDNDDNDDWGGTGDDGNDDEWGNVGVSTKQWTEEATIAEKLATAPSLCLDSDTSEDENMGIKEEYQAFPYEFFRKRVYEVRQKALAAPYWQVKRNKSGKELHRLQTNEMREKWALDVQVEKITDMLNRGLAF